jgi:malonate decarboxylase gamma subunit
MSQFPNRAALWLNKLAPDAPLMSGLCPSVQVADGQIDGESVRFIAVVPDANNHYPRAAGGEVGLLEGWTLAKVVNETIAADADQPVKRPIVAVIDVPARPMAAAKKLSASTRRWPGRQAPTPKPVLPATR